MSTTVAAFAKELRKSSEVLLEQLRHAGVAKNVASDPLTDGDKQQLMRYLQDCHGLQSVDRLKITQIKKSTYMEGDVTGRARKIQLEVRKKRTFIHSDDVTVAEAEVKTAPSLAPVAATADLGAFNLPGREEQELRDFVAELEAALREISDAVKQSQKATEEISELKEKLDNRGWFGAFSANFSGSTQKDLTAQVLALSKSVSVTQQVIRVMLKAQTQSDRVLRAFNDALVRKIVDVQADTKTLDGSQRSAALALLGELQRQVQEHVRQRELVEIHEGALQGLRQESINATAVLAGVETDLAQLQDWSAALERRVDSIGQWQMDRDSRDAESASKMACMVAVADEMRPRLSQLEAWGRDKEVDDLALRQQLSQSVSHVVALKKHIDGLESRLATLEASQLQERSLGARIERQVPALIAAGLAAAAMLRAVGAA